MDGGGAPGPRPPAGLGGARGFFDSTLRVALHAFAGLCADDLALEQRGFARGVRSVWLVLALAAWVAGAPLARAAVLGAAGAGAALFVAAGALCALAAVVGRT